MPLVDSSDHSLIVQSRATVMLGQSASFSVTAAAPPTLAYQRYFNGAAITGDISAKYSIATCQTANAGPYSVVDTGPEGSVTSASASLTVYPRTPDITVRLLPATFSAGESVTFSVMASDRSPFTYHW